MMNLFDGLNCSIFPIKSFRSGSKLMYHSYFMAGLFFEILSVDNNVSPSLPLIVSISLLLG